MTTSPPTVLTRSVRYQADGGRLLRHLASRRLLTVTAPGPGAIPRPVDTVLLESVDIATKVSRTTIAVLEASTRLTCEGQQVRVDALASAHADGRAAISRLRNELADYIVPESHPSHDGDASRSVTHTPVHDADEAALDSLLLRFPDLNDTAHLEERERLTAISTIEPLRRLAAVAVDHPHLPLEAGVVAFDYLATIESLPAVALGANTCPDYVFYDARIILVVDHPTRTATLVGASIDADGLAARLEELASAIDSIDADTPASDVVPAASATPDAPTRAPVHAVPTQSDADYADTVERMQEAIGAGEVYQVVPSRGFTMPCPDALAAYHHLREANPSPYMFYLATPDFELFGASPESALLHSARTGQVAIRPIAGTRPRGLDAHGNVDHEQDTRLELELRTDAKEIAEHVMLVDLARNDVARVSKPGTRQVVDLLRVDRYSRVMHLVSEVTGTLDTGLDALDAFRASMTMGTLTGAPKLRAAELIRQAEGVRRGSYGGSVGYIRGDGELDTCIVIRSAFVTGGQALVQAGAGVVASSDPRAEAAETVHKASAVLHAIADSCHCPLVIDTEPVRVSAAAVAATDGQED